MMKIVHLSDLHFGTHDRDVNAVDMLLDALLSIRPDLVIISGDFTQIGSREEFEMAQQFLSVMPFDFLCVPGNHDIPARHLWKRFFSPYNRYRAYISEELNPVYKNDIALIAGVNSARRTLPHWNWANGAVSGAQRESLKQFFDPEEKRWTICTLHHPLHKVDEMPLDVTVFGRKRAMQTIRACKVDLVLTGHVHYASLVTRGDGYHQTVYLSASTALSNRRRGQENGFNLITLWEEEMQIDIFKLAQIGFIPVQSYHLHKYD